MAMETTEKATSETLRNLELTVANFCVACCQIKKILDNGNLPKDERIKRSQELLNELAEKYMELAH